MLERELKPQEIILNLGPQHPSTHGVFRLVLVLDGETVVKAIPVMGYLHRGIEQLAEKRTYLQDLILTDRTDYLAAMSNNLGYCLTVEKLMGVEATPRANYLRVIMAELNRIASHLMAIGTFASDVGTFFTPFMYMFVEREKILDLFESVCGARLTYSYIRFGGVMADLPEGWEDRCRKFLDEFPAKIAEFEELLSTNEIFLARTRGIGPMTPEQAINWSVSGSLLRASGVNWDIRRAFPYCGYEQFDFKIPLGTNGDCFDRYWVRLQEMRQSTNIVRQALDGLPGGEVMAKMPKVLRPPAGEAYARIEGPRGELGYYMVSDGGLNPYRWKIRAPSFINLSVLPAISVGWKIADVIAILGSIDIVMGEVDR